MGLGPQVADNQDYLKDVNDTIVTDLRKSLDIAGRLGVLHVVEMIAAC